MAEHFESSNNRCYACLSSNRERHLHTYYIKKLIFKTILQMDKLVLCYLCKRIAIQTEKFIHNVETSQALFANSKNEQIFSSESYKTIIHPLINLERLTISSENIITINSNELEEQLIKNEFEIADIAGEFITEMEIKKEEQTQDLENDFETVNLDQEPVIYDSPGRDTASPIGVVHTKTSRNKGKAIKPEDGDFKDPMTDEKQSKTNLKEFGAKMFTLTMEQLREERALKATEKKYLDATFKCENCIKAFVMKTPYENHMKLHDKKRGEFECVVCKQRLKTKFQLENHYSYHFNRYKCSKCDVTRNCENSLKDHYLRQHSEPHYEYSCPVCFQQFRFRSSLSKHKDKHKAKARIKCKYCEKTFASESAIGYHLKYNHTAEESATLKPYTCTECGRSFKMRQKLNNHMVSHTSRRDHYCVECDKSFKTRTALNLHFRTVLAHNTNKNSDLQENTSYLCAYCEKSFPKKKALGQHISNMHLNTTMQQCSQCGKTFKSKKRLTIHVLSHEEGFEQHKKHCCTICNKRFYEKSVLSKHMNIHTGNKPFQCGQCSAQFGHSGSLYNHTRLVHLRLTRAGKPRPAHAPRRTRHSNN